MESKNRKRISPILGKKERYNGCSYCGGEVYIYIDESGECCVDCAECDCNNMAINIPYVPSEDVVDTCRKRYNTLVTLEMYSPKALKKMNVCAGEYIVTDMSDGYMVFSGDVKDTLRFLKHKSETEKNRTYEIHFVLENGFYKVGKSFFAESIQEKI
jgi:hypothetical protein